MKRRFLGLFLLLAVSAMFVACGDSDSSNKASEDDLCTNDPNAPGCEINVPSEGADE
ncbi:MAG: hypothetical protein MJY98_13030 [Fibrobacter sp.]|nr:hypothetical protein [Fibrobacter sp.]